MRWRDDKNHQDCRRTGSRQHGKRSQKQAARCMQQEMFDVFFEPRAERMQNAAKPLGSAAPTAKAHQSAAQLGTGSGSVHGAATGGSSDVRAASSGPTVSDNDWGDFVGHMPEEDITYYDGMSDWNDCGQDQLEVLNGAAEEPWEMLPRAFESQQDEPATAVGANELSIAAVPQRRQDASAAATPMDGAVSRAPVAGSSQQPLASAAGTSAGDHQLLSTLTAAHTTAVRAKDDAAAATQKTQQAEQTAEACQRALEQAQQALSSALAALGEAWEAEGEMNQRLAEAKAAWMARID